LSIDKASGDLSTVFTLDATASKDFRDGKGANSKLEVRWDFNGDGQWDTAFSTEKLVKHMYNTPGKKTVVAEIRNSRGFERRARRSVYITQETPSYVDRAAERAEARERLQKTSSYMRYINANKSGVASTPRMSRLQKAKTINLSNSSAVGISDIMTISTKKQNFALAGGDQTRYTTTLTNTSNKPVSNLIIRFETPEGVNGGRLYTTKGNFTGSTFTPSITSGDIDAGMIEIARIPAGAVIQINHILVADTRDLTSKEGTALIKSIATDAYNRSSVMSESYYTIVEGDSQVAGFDETHRAARKNQQKALASLIALSMIATVARKVFRNR
jgi:uncharacterized repeat protein (TIGR01451 family)